MISVETITMCSVYFSLFDIDNMDKTKFVIHLLLYCMLNSLLVFCYLYWRSKNKKHG